MKYGKNLLLLFVILAGMLVGCSSESGESGIEAYLAEKEADGTETEVKTDFNETEETEAETEANPVTLTAEYSSGEFRTGHEGNFNDNVTIEVKFTAKLERTTYRRGETVKIYARVENVGEKFMYVYSYGAPDAWLEHEDICDGKYLSNGYARYSIFNESIPVPDIEPSEVLCESGDSWGITSKINIPDNAIIGKYDIKIASHGYITVIKDAVEIVE